MLQGLSEELKRIISDTGIAIIGAPRQDVIGLSLSRMGCRNITVSTSRSEYPICEVAVCKVIEKRWCRDVLAYYSARGIPVICAFNFGIGSCVTIVDTYTDLPAFVADVAPDDVETAMLSYADGYSKFWHIARNDWVAAAGIWLDTPQIRASIGDFTLAAMVTHLLAAMLAGNKVKKYPDFYLSTIADDVG